MGNATAIVREIVRHKAEMDRLVSAFKARIAELPDNPRIQRLSPKCFVASFSDVTANQTVERTDGSKTHIGSNWSPEHHDFKEQYRHLIELVSRSSDRPIQIVYDAIKSGRIRVGEPKYTITLHPDVVWHLRELLAEETR